MQNSYTTVRLLLNKLTVDDHEFILELVNTPEWIKYIGNRKIKSNKEAIVYVQKMIDSPHINYWVVKSIERQIPMGIVTFIKRDYLEHYDIGFAFLAKYTGKGYAHEAATAILHDVKEDPSHTQILATTLKENANSIRLLEKLGFRYMNEIEVENENLLVYGITTDELQ